MAELILKNAKITTLDCGRPVASAIGQGRVLAVGAEDEVMPFVDAGTRVINAAAPDTSVFVLHLYGRALLNRAALKALGITSETPDPPGGLIERDGRGTPTGMLIAKPSALILYSTLARGPKLGFEDEMNSTRHFMRELNRLGITSVIDAGGGGQNYPDDYRVITELHDAGQLTVRIAYNLFAQKAGEELGDYERWVAMTEPGAGDTVLRMNGGRPPEAADRFPVRDGGTRRVAGGAGVGGVGRCADAAGVHLSARRMRRLHCPRVAGGGAPTRAEGRAPAGDRAQQLGGGQDRTAGHVDSLFLKT